jgi:hypothetical protein
VGGAEAGDCPHPHGDPRLGMIDAQSERSIAVRSGQSGVDGFGVCVVSFQPDLGTGGGRDVDDLIGVALQGMGVGDRHRASAQRRRRRGGERQLLGWCRMGGDGVVRARDRDVLRGGQGDALAPAKRKGQAHGDNDHDGPRNNCRLHAMSVLGLRIDGHRIPPCSAALRLSAWLGE